MSPSFPSCFRPTTHHHSMPAPPISGNPNLTTSLYTTNFGLLSLTWSHTYLGHSLQISLPSLSYFSLHIKSFKFWNNKGSKNLQFNNQPKIAHFLWDFSKVIFGSKPDPESGFYIALVIDGDIALLIGDCIDKAYSKIKAIKTEVNKNSQFMVLRTEHVYGSKLYRTKAKFGDKIREITIDYRLGDELTLCFSVDGIRVLEIQHLKWKFRGNERIEIDGVYVQISWDLYNWLFKKGQTENGYALFMFRFEELGCGDGDYLELNQLSQKNCNGLLGFERRKFMNRVELTSERRSSSFSSSLSSASSSNCSSVMDWESMEESELKGNSGFSLAIYAWKK